MLELQTTIVLWYKSMGNCPLFPYSFCFSHGFSHGFSQGFSIFFPSFWFSQGFPMVFPWFLHFSQPSCHVAIGLLQRQGAEPRHQPRRGGGLWRRSAGGHSERRGRTGPAAAPRLASAAFNGNVATVPSGKHTKNYGKSPFLMGKSTINHHFQ